MAPLSFGEGLGVRNMSYIIFVFGITVPLFGRVPRQKKPRVGLSVPAFFCWAEKAQQKKSSTSIPHAV
ncbi:MAG: hypothetical protein QG594_1655 [Bacteroidota bacterium]|nr:hypothetical protein [Bacteroidota bacterium]